MPMDVLNGAAFTGVPLLGAWNWGLGGTPATTSVQAVAGADIFLPGAAAPSEIKRADSAIEPPTKMASSQWFVLEDLVGTISALMRVASEGGLDIRARYADFLSGGDAGGLIREIRVLHKGALHEDVHEAIFQSPDPGRAVVELVSNGIDWSEAGQQVDVLARDGVFEVADRGRGMDLLTIFERLLVPKLTAGTAAGARIGRFGIGFYTVLRHLVSAECTNPADYRRYLVKGALVEILTCAASGEAHRIQFAVDGGRILVAVRRTEGVQENGTRIRVSSPKVKAASVIGSVASKFRYGRGPVGVFVNGQRINAPVPGEREALLSSGIAVRWMPDSKASEAVILCGDPLVERHAGGAGAARGSLVIELPRATRLSIIREGIEVNGRASEWFQELVGLADRDDIFGGVADRLSFLNLAASLAAGLEREGRNLSEVSLIDAVRAKVSHVTRGKRIYPDEPGLARALARDAGDAHIVAAAAYPSEAYQSFESPGEYRSGWMEDDAGLKKTVRVFISPDLKDDVYVDRKNGVVWMARAAYGECDPAVWEAFFIAARELGIHVEWGKTKGAVAEKRHVTYEETARDGADKKGATPAALSGSNKDAALLLAPPTEEERQAFAGFKFLESMGVRPTDAMPALPSTAIVKPMESVVSNGKRYLVVGYKEGNFIFCEDRGRVYRLIHADGRIKLFENEGRAFAVAYHKGSDWLIDLDGPHTHLFKEERTVITFRGAFFMTYNSANGKAAVYLLKNPSVPAWVSPDICLGISDDHFVTMGNLFPFLSANRLFVLQRNFDNRTSTLLDTATGNPIPLMGREFHDDIRKSGDLVFVQDGRMIAIFHQDDLDRPLAVMETPENSRRIAYVNRGPCGEGGSRFVYQIAFSNNEDRLIEYDPESKSIVFDQNRYSTANFVHRGLLALLSRAGIFSNGVRIWREMSSVGAIKMKLTDVGEFFLARTEDAVIIRDVSDPDWERRAEPVLFDRIHYVFRCGRKAYAVFRQDGHEILHDLDDPARTDIKKDAQSFSRQYGISATVPGRLVSLAGDGAYKDFGSGYRIEAFRGGFWILCDEDAERRGEERDVIVEEGSWRETVVHNMVSGLEIVPHGIELIFKDTGFRYLFSADRGVQILERDNNPVYAIDSLGRLVFSSGGDHITPLSLYNSPFLPVKHSRTRVDHIFDLGVWQKLSDPRYQSRVRELAKHRLFPLADYLPAVLHARDDLWERLIADPERRHLVRYLNGRGFEAYLAAHPKARRRELEWVAYLDEMFGPLQEGRVGTFLRKIERLVASSIDLNQVVEDLNVGRESEDAMAVLKYLSSDEDFLLMDGGGLIDIEDGWNPLVPLAGAVGLFRMGRTGRFSNFAAAGTGSEIDRRAITHVVDNLRVGSPFAFMGQLLRGAGRRLGLNGKGQKLRITTSLVGGRMQLGIEFPVAMGEEAMVEELVHINGHEMGKGLLGALKDAEWVRVESSGGGWLSSRVRAEVKRLRDGGFGLRWRHARGGLTEAATTKIEIRMAGTNPFLDAARLAVHLEEIGRYYTGGPELVFNGRKLNEGASVPRARARVEGLGSVSLHEGYGERLLVGGLKVMDIPASVMDSVAEGIRTLFTKQGFLIDLDEREVGLVPSGARLVDQDTVLARLAQVLPGLLVQAFLSRVMDPSRREDIRSLPDTYFLGIYEMAKDATLGAEVVRDARAINRGRHAKVDYTRYRDERELLKLMTLVNFIPHRGGLISIRDLYGMVGDVRRADEVTALLPLLPEAIRTRINFELEHRKHRDAWRQVSSPSGDGPGADREWQRASAGLAKPYALYLEFLESVIGAYFDGAIVTGVQTYSGDAGTYARHYQERGTYHLLRTLSDWMEGDVREFAAALDEARGGEGRGKWDRLLAKTVEEITHELTHLYTETGRDMTHDPKFYLYQLGLIPRARGARLDPAALLAQMLEQAHGADLTVPKWKEAVR